MESQVKSRLDTNNKTTLYDSVIRVLKFESDQTSNTQPHPLFWHNPQKLESSESLYPIMKKFPYISKENSNSSLITRDLDIPAFSNTNKQNLTSKDLRIKPGNSSLAYFSQVPYDLRSESQLNLSHKPYETSRENLGSTLTSLKRHVAKLNLNKPVLIKSNREQMNIYSENSPTSKRIEDILLKNTPVEDAANQVVTLESLNSFSGKKSPLDSVAQSHTSGANSNQDLVIKRNKTGVTNEEANRKDPTAKLSCNCKKSKCLKLYCDCFAVGESCGKDCKCADCFNNEENSKERQAAIDAILYRNPTAFKPKVHVPTNVAVLNPETGEQMKHTKGCNCKKSGCLKKYCECFQAGVKCTDLCRCEGCKNCNHTGHDHDGRKGMSSLNNFESPNNFSSPSSVKHRHGMKRKGRKGISESMLRESEDRENDGEESDVEHPHPRKKIAVTNFNVFREANLVCEDDKNPYKIKIKQEPLSGIKVKEEHDEIHVKTEEVSTKQVRKRKPVKSRK